MLPIKLAEFRNSCTTIEKIYGKLYLCPDHLLHTLGYSFLGVKLLYVFRASMLGN